MPEEVARGWQFNFRIWYLVFGFLDHFYDAIIAAGPDDDIWTDADILVWLGTIFRSVGFTAHPRYLEVAELLGVTDVKGDPRATRFLPQNGRQLGLRIVETDIPNLT